MSDNVIPIVWCLIVNLFYVTMQIFVKLLQTQISTQYILTIRSLCLLILNTIILVLSPQYKTKYTPTHGNQIFQFNIRNRVGLVLMLKRQIWNTLAINLYLSSLKHLSISIAQSLYNTSPILIFFVQAYFYQKPITKRMLILTFVAFSGVLILLNPISSAGNSSNVSIWLLSPLLAAVCYSVSMVYLHEMKNKFHQTIVLQYAYVSQSLISSSLMCIIGNGHVDWKPKDGGYQWWIIIILITLVVLLAYGAHLFRIKATFAKKPSELMVYNYFGVLYSICIDALFFQTQITPITLIGLLMTSAGLLAHLKISL